MEYFDASNVQFLDLSGVEEQEKNWILTSLQTRDSKVKGPWGKASFRTDHALQHGCTTTSNHVPNYTQYQTPNLMVTNHAINNTIPHQATAVYQYTTATTPIYQAPFITPINQYPTPVQVPAQINAPIIAPPALVRVNQYTPQQQPQQLQQHVTYPNIVQPIMTNTYSQQQQQQQQPVIINNCVNKTDDCVDVQPQQPNDIINNGCKNEVFVDDNNASNKSWASLFNKGAANGDAMMMCEGNQEEAACFMPKNASSSFIQSGENEHVLNSGVPTLNASRKAEFDDPNYYRMGEFLTSQGVDHTISSLQPRGLINRSNYCYINSILQALMACPPLYNLLNGLAANVNVRSNEKRKHSQMIDNMAKFVKEFHYLPATQRVTRRSDNKNTKKEQSMSINCETPFEPYWIYKMLSGIKSDSFVVEGRQEDAEEFLGCLLNGLNDEMLELMKLIEEDKALIANDTIENEKLQQQQQQVEGSKDWVVMGPKNKSAVTRRTEIVRTPISDIFGGHSRSRLHRAGDQITDNIQPFFTLQLNIEKVNTVREALEALVCKNQLEGVTSSKTNEEVEAWQQWTIEELPIVLVLHLKCFDFKLDGCTKILKALEFPVDLKVDAKLLSSKMNYTPKEKQYKLFAVVYHDGKEATKGHYLTDAYHVGYASWLRYDDAAVKAVQEEHVLNPHGTRVPYLLFYRRCDSVRTTK